MKLDEDRERVRLSVGTLARFAEGIGWDRIHSLDPSHGTQWWRQAVADSEERGLIAWDRRMRVWRLSDAGRAVVRSVS